MRLAREYFLLSKVSRQGYRSKQSAANVCRNYKRWTTLPARNESQPDTDASVPKSSVKCVHIARQAGSVDFSFRIKADTEVHESRYACWFIRSNPLKSPVEKCSYRIKRGI